MQISSSLMQSLCLASSLVPNHMLLCSSALQYILPVVLKFLFNLTFFFLKKAFVYWGNLVSLLCDQILAGCFSWCHPSIHNTSELKLLVKNNFWSIESSRKYSVSVLKNINIIMFFLKNFFFLFYGMRRLLECANWKLLLPLKYVQSCWIL